MHPNPANWADHPPMYGDFIAREFPVNGALRSHHNSRRPYVSLNGTFNLQVAAGDKAALNNNICPDN